MFGSAQLFPYIYIYIYIFIATTTQATTRGGWDCRLGAALNPRFAGERKKKGLFGDS